MESLRKGVSFGIKWQSITCKGIIIPSAEVVKAPFASCNKFHLFDHEVSIQSVEGKCVVMYLFLLLISHIILCYFF